MNDITIFSHARLSECYNEALRKHLTQWIERPTQSLYMVGIYGCGKTWTAYAIINELKLRKQIGFTYYFIEAPEMTAQLRQAIMVNDGYHGSENDLIDKWSDADLLVIDDLGRGKQTERSQEQFYRIINNRYKRGKITIVTTNFMPDELNLDEATVARMQPWKIITFDNVDRRIQKNMVNR